MLLLQILSCPKCGIGNFQKNENAISCLQCGAEFAVRNGKVFFIEPPLDAPPPEDRDDYHIQNKWGTARKAEFEYFKEKLSECGNDSVLIDLGTGRAHFRELFERFRNWYGLDFYPHKHVSIVADFNNPLPLRNNSVDIIILSNVLEHIPYPAFLLKECHRVLKDGGKVIGAMPFLAAGHQRPYDYNRFTDFMLEKILLDSGFHKAEVSALGKPLDVYQKMQKTFFRQLFKVKFSQNKFIYYFKYATAQAAWRLNKFILFLFLRIYSKAAATPVYTESHGFIGVKNN